MFRGLLHGSAHYPVIMYSILFAWHGAEVPNDAETLRGHPVCSVTKGPYPSVLQQHPLCAEAGKMAAYVA